MSRRRTPTRWAALAALVLAAAYGLLDVPLSELTGGSSGAQAVAALYETRTSGEMVEVEGTVEKRLSDDLKGSRHQRFILRLAPGMTVLVSHNIDLAPRIDALRDGDRVFLRGQYEWNEKGGVIHWTHHDPDGRRTGGYIEHEGRAYR